MGSLCRLLKDKVQLIPWDARDAAHKQRMFDQRVACTWGSDEVELWSEKVIEGGKYLYWIVLADDLEDGEELLRQHTEKFEAERTPLLDSATTLGKTTRQPTNTPFTPIGHIALEGYPGRDERFNLPAGKTLWVKSLYISAALQSSGLGRAAMAAIESAAAGAPHNCTVIALDTTSDAWQRSERSLTTFYDDRGLPRPKVVRTNEEWYRRQGYALMDLPPVQEGKTWAREKGVNGELGFYIWVGPETGEEIRVPAVYMWKSIV